MLKPKEIKRVYAIARLLLDNVRNIKVLWNYLGLEEAQEILNCGGNDLGSTALEEKIITMAGGIKINMTQENMNQVISCMGRTPKKIHSGHQYESEFSKT